MHRRFQLTVMIFMLTIALWLGFWLTQSEARIIIVPPPHPPHPPQPITLAVSEYAVQVFVEQQIAHVEVRQVFKNDTGRELEGIFLFPLPDDAQVSEFTLVADGRRLEGEILDKDRARDIYESIVRQHKDPALLEYVDNRLFRARIYPIPPHRERVLEFSYDQILTADHGLVELYFPLRHEITEVFLDRFDFSVEIKSDLPLRTVYSPTYDVAIDRMNDYRAAIRLVDPRIKLDLDFILYFSASTDEMDMTLLTHRQPGEDGYFIAMITPEEAEDTFYLPKDFIFVLDNSGSMKGEKIEQAREALIYCLSNLDRRDRFNIIAFEAEVDVFYPRLVQASDDYVTEAKEFAHAIRARGGTNINGALRAALDLVSTDERPAQIVFLTDGLPTVGEQDSGEILASVRHLNRYDARIFPFGVGYDVNTHLLDLLAEQNHGAADYVRPGEDIEVKVSNLYEKISRPVLSNVTLDFGQRVYDLYPPHIPDLFAGSQLIVLGRYTGSGWKAVRLSGVAEDDTRSWTYEAEFPARNWANEFIPRLWASRKIGFLMDEIRLHGENSELIDEIVRLSEEFGIITPYTSFLVEEERTLSRWDDDRSIIQQQAKKGVQSGLVDDREVSGERAVTKSLYSQQLKESKSTQNYSAATDTDSYLGSMANAFKSSIASGHHAPVPEASADQKREKVYKQVGTRTFYKAEGVWVDSQHSLTNKIIAIKPYSPAYFEFVQKYPALKKELSIGDRIIIAFKGVSLHIDQNGLEKINDGDWKLIEKSIMGHKSPE